MAQSIAEVSYHYTANRLGIPDVATINSDGIRLSEKIDTRLETTVSAVLFSRPDLSSHYTFAYLRYLIRLCERN